MGNAGEARLDVVALARDEVSVVMNKVSAEIDQLKAKVASYEKVQRASGQAAKEAAAGVAAFGDKAASLKESVAPFNKVKEALSQVRENFFFFGTAVAGAVTLATGLVKAFADAVVGSSVASERWRAAQAGMADGLERTRSILADIERFLGTAPSDFDQLASRVSTRLGEIREAIVAGESALKEHRETYESIVSIVPGLAIMEDAHNASLKKDIGDITKLKEQQVKLAREEDELLASQVINVTKYAGLLRWLRGDKSPAGDAKKPVNPFLGTSDDPSLSLTALRKAVEDAQREVEAGKGKGRGRKHGDLGNYDALFGLDVTDEMRANTDAYLRAIGTAPTMADEGAGILVTESAFADNVQSIFDMADGAQRLADALTLVGDATGALVGERFPELATALGEIRDISQGVADGQVKLGEALAAGGTAIAANAARAIGGVRAEAGVRAAYEFAMGFATLAQPAVSAGHFTAAALLGAVAAGAGRDGGGARDGARGGRDSDARGVGGPTTVVYNFSTLVTDKQQVTSAISQAQRSSRGTGSGRGV